MLHCPFCLGLPDIEPEPWNRSPDPEAFCGCRRTLIRHSVVTSSTSDPFIGLQVVRVFRMPSLRGHRWESCMDLERDRLHLRYDSGREKRVRSEDAEATLRRFVRRSDKLLVQSVLGT